MIERVVENWLISAGERSYQIPFCQALLSRGQKVLHSTRHCAMEMGKDIIAQDSDGHIHVYQLKSLKGGRLTQSAYRSDIAPQLHPLVLGKPVHPSIPEGAKVKAAYIVMSGDINEEAAREIDDLNKTLAENNIQTSIKTITFGELLQLFIQNLHRFAPAEPRQAKMFLELFLADGTGAFPKEKLWRLLESVFHFEKKPSETELREALSSSALISTLALSNFQQNENWFAEFEGWTVYLVALLRFAEAWSLSDEEISVELDIALAAMFGALEGLAKELCSRETLFEGHALADSVLLNFKRPIMLGMASLYLIWAERLNVLPKDHTEKLFKFIREQYGKISFWGESAGPYILANLLFMRRAGYDNMVGKFLCEVMDQVLTRNGRHSQFPMPSPYYGFEECLLSLAGAPDQAIEDDFTHSSFLLEPILHLMVENGMRDELTARWAQITHFSLRSFLPASSYDFLSFRAKQGNNMTRIPKMTESWTALMEATSKLGGGRKIDFFNKHPYALAALLVAMPQRLNSDVGVYLFRSFEPPPKEGSAS